VLGRVWARVGSDGEGVVVKLINDIDLMKRIY
jgi:hypothetical protein